MSPGPWVTATASHFPGGSLGSLESLIDYLEDYFRVHARRYLGDNSSEGVMNVDLRGNHV